jgi:hypothetical protein
MNSQIKDDALLEFGNGGITFAASHSEPVTWADLY